MKKIALIIIVTALCFVVTGLNPAMAAKKFPKKPITIICPWSAGGGTDRTARFIADKLHGVLGVPVNVVNKTGGAGAVGFNAGANAKPDGYVITNLTFEIGTLRWMGYSDLGPEAFRPQDVDAAVVGRVVVGHRRGKPDIEPLGPRNDLLAPVRVDLAREVYLQRHVPSFRLTAGDLARDASIGTPGHPRRVPPVAFATFSTIFAPTASISSSVSVVQARPSSLPSTLTRRLRRHSTLERTSRESVRPLVTLARIRSASR